MTRAPAVFVRLRGKIPSTPILLAAAVSFYLVRESMKVRILLLLVLLAGGVYDYIENGDRRDRKPPVTGAPAFG